MTKERVPRILMISHDNFNGGAARAASRLFECLNLKGVKVDFLVAKKTGDLKGIKKISLIQSAFIIVTSRLDKFLSNLLESKNPHWKTSAFWGVLRAKNLNKIDYELINLHWIGHGLISLRQLKKIKKPILWTLHDEWILNPISHYSDGNEGKFNLIRALLLENRSQSKKKFLFNRNVNLVTLNTSIAEQLKKMYPEIKEKIFTVPNPVNTKIFYPMPRKKAEKLIELRNKKPYILYLGGTSDSRKGWDLLEKSLALCTSSFDVRMIGAVSKNIQGKFDQIRIETYSRVSDLNKMCALYSQAAAVVIPSRFEGLPQVATESLCCGTPIIGFDIGGLKDIILDQRNGIMVPRFDTISFAQALDFIIVNKRNKYQKFCREFALSNFSYNSISAQYKKIMIQITRK